MGSEEVRARNQQTTFIAYSVYTWCFALDTLSLTAVWRDGYHFSYFIGHMAQFKSQAPKLHCGVEIQALLLIKWSEFSQID